jgi:hypothetical protein
MTFVPLQQLHQPTQSDHLARQIHVARELALNDAGRPARQLCGSVFLDHAMLLTRDEKLLKAYVECLLLLEMTALLPRVIQAIYGVSLAMAPLTGPGPRRWQLVFGNSVTLELASPGSRADRVVREQVAAQSSARILAVAAQDHVVAAATRSLEPA